MVETFGYVGSCGRACLTLPRFVTKVSTPGRAWSIFCRKPGDFSTDCRIGRSPVCREKYVACGAAVIQVRNFSAAATRLDPLLKITQLSGPEMVWWPPLLPGNDGMTCTPYFTLGKPDRSQGPVTSIPIFPELNRLAYSESVGSRYMDLSVTAMDRRVLSDSSPAGESNAALVLLEFSICPPASQSSASQCQTVSSLPGVT